MVSLLPPFSHYILFSTHSHSNPLKTQLRLCHSFTSNSQMASFHLTKSKSHGLKITDKALTWSLATFLIILHFVHSSTDSCTLVILWTQHTSSCLKLLCIFFLRRLYLKLSSLKYPYSSPQMSPYHCVLPDYTKILTPTDIPLPSYLASLFSIPLDKLH